MSPRRKALHNTSTAGHPKHGPSSHSRALCPFFSDCYQGKTVPNLTSDKCFLLCNQDFWRIFFSFCNCCCYIHGMLVREVCECRELNSWATSHEIPIKQARRKCHRNISPRNWIECIFAHVSSVICETNIPCAFSCKLWGLNTTDNSPSYIYAS